MELIWKDRKRIMGLPLTFKKYALYNSKLIHTVGLLFQKEGEILLYRIMDVELRISLFDRLFGVGTIFLFTGDSTDKIFKIEKIKTPREVLSLINENIAEDKKRISLRINEFQN